MTGSAISSGLFVPMLMLGAVIGRFMGLATVDIAQAAGTRWSPGGSGEGWGPGARSYQAACKLLSCMKRLHELGMGSGLGEPVAS